MTYTTSIKEEISKQNSDAISARTELSAFIRFDGKIKKDKITLTIENASVARRIYTLIKTIFGIKPRIIVRNQRRLRIKQIYILEINDKISSILEDLNIIENNKLILPNNYFLDTKEDKISYLKGVFLSCGSISNPQTSGYHLEFTLTLQKEAKYIADLLKQFNISSKIIKRTNHYMLYVKSAEMISDVLRMLNATNSLFFFEDIRIYRDHKNMVNRLNNCEIANQEKIIQTGLKQLTEIEYLKKHDLTNLLDEKIQEVIKFREKYPESSYQELAEIISKETGKTIGKSGINHYFRKIKELVEKHKNSHQTILSTNPYSKDSVADK